MPFASAYRFFTIEPLYFDVGRIDSEGRISALKDQMNGWLEEATRRIPTLLILDNLDTLLSPENEVRDLLSLDEGDPSANRENTFFQAELFT